VLAARRLVLFNPGPVNLDPRIKEHLFDVELCHRQPEFDELRARVVSRLYDVAALSPATHRLSLLHGSGALAVDAALASLVRGRALVVSNGLYCERIAATLSGIGADVAILDCGIGVPPDLDELATAARDAEPDWIACVHHETTTGLLNPLPAVADAAEAVGARLFVDGVSSFGVHPLDPRVDVACFNSNKCLESLPGIAGVLWREELEIQPTVPVLDVSAYADAIPVTPHVQAFVALDLALELHAVEDRPARYERLARHVWARGGRDFELLLPRAHRSHVLTSFKLGGRDPDELAARALEAGYVIYHGQRHLRNEIFRVANMGAAIDEVVIDDLFDVLAR
jgi:2-aminoethylphosphonate-pyruvate transaminase